MRVAKSRCTAASAPILVHPSTAGVLLRVALRASMVPPVGLAVSGCTIIERVPTILGSVLKPTAVHTVFEEVRVTSRSGSNGFELRFQETVKSGVSSTVVAAAAVEMVLAAISATASARRAQTRDRILTCVVLCCVVSCVYAMVHIRGH